MTLPLQHLLVQREHEHFARLYGAAVADQCVERFAMLLGRYGLETTTNPAATEWSERDAVLITYGDMLSAPVEYPLQTLKHFLDNRLQGAINTVHVLPFFPSSSDDGFSVMHYRRVEPLLGAWADVQALGEHFRLIFDLVLNHVSSHSPWFYDFRNGIAPGRDFFITADPAADYSAVARPRATPLLTPTHTSRGIQHVWTTFSADQMDLQWSDPDVFFELLDILLFYVSMGARIVRLDAVAYLWKRPGTACLHLPETHTVIQLFRDFLALGAPQVQLLTETNVAHADNISYFGAGDEAHLVYQFTLPPLLLHAYRTGDARPLTRWAQALQPPPSGCAFVNFIASHDGIGLRPAEGWLTPGQLDALVAGTLAAGGQVSHKLNADGSTSPYELNITWFDALQGAQTDTPAVHLCRFLGSHALMLTLQGIPAIYFNSLIAAPNNVAGVAQTGQARTINRKKWNLAELEARLADGTQPNGQALAGLLHLLQLRAMHPAFGPKSQQRVHDLAEAVFAVERQTPDGQQRIVGLFNCSNAPAKLTNMPSTWVGADLISERPFTAAGASVILAPYEYVWLKLS